MVLDPITQSLPVHFFGSRPQPPTSLLWMHPVYMRHAVYVSDITHVRVVSDTYTAQRHERCVSMCIHSLQERCVFILSRYPLRMKHAVNASDETHVSHETSASIFSFHPLRSGVCVLQGGAVSCSVLHCVAFVSILCIHIVRHGSYLVSTRHESFVVCRSHDLYLSDNICIYAIWLVWVMTHVSY